MMRRVISVYQRQSPFPSTILIQTHAPVISVSESGTSGIITLSATATDNTGVTKVEFYVDNILKGTDTTSPYSMTLDSLTLSEGDHVLVGKAYDDYRSYRYFTQCHVYGYSPRAYTHHLQRG